MAEGLLRAIYGDRYEAYSAGVETTTVNPHAIVVMKEIGIDISSQHSKTPQEFQDIIFDLAVTVCDRAKVGLSHLQHKFGAPESVSQSKRSHSRKF
jgi:arsenate reductase